MGYQPMSSPSQGNPARPLASIPRGIGDIVDGSTIVVAAVATVLLALAWRRREHAGRLARASLLFGPLILIMPAVLFLETPRGRQGADVVTMAIAIGVGIGLSAANLRLPQPEHRLTAATFLVTHATVGFSCLTDATFWWGYRARKWTPGVAGVAMWVWLFGMLWIGTLSSFRARRLEQAERRRRAGLCARCSYDLRGGGGERCPECGEPRDPTAVTEQADA
jgi:hypothetical protein